MCDCLFLDKPRGFNGHKSPLIHLQIWDQTHSWLSSARVASGTDSIVPLDIYI